MSKIDELLNEYNIEFDVYATIHQHHFNKILKEYAEWYAMKCLEKAETYLPIDVCITGVFPTEIEFPPHE